ncbi:UNVERIFIED_CONTAM: hypothetical protein PYX00_004268 [Menopon gallinae]|uniref:Uncharacterized protein n=1 Tax=Menopon gallinae TaxID=328185 RepID=A0AAW2I3T0_9NEOP
MNQRQYEAKRKEIEKHFLSDDEMAVLEESLKSMRLTVQPRAIPMPVATRGVGFASAIEYSGMITTWNVEAIEVICSIHQYYRVNMFLLYYKLYLANRDQGEMLSYPIEGVMIMSEEIRQIVAPISQIPIAISNILHAAGKVEGEVTFHARMIPDAPMTGEQMAVYLSPLKTRRGAKNPLVPAEGAADAVLSVPPPPPESGREKEPSKSACPRVLRVGTREIDDSCRMNRPDSASTLSELAPRSS